jgi:hypothetical protein
MANPSTETIIGLARDLMREESGSDVPTIGDAFMIQAVAEVDRELGRVFRRGGGNAPEAQALEGGDDIPSSTQIDDTGGIDEADTTITADSTSEFESSGAAVIWDANMHDVFYYTGTTATSFTGVTGLGLDHDDNDEIQPLIALPSNFGHFRRTEQYGDGVQLNGSPLYYMDGPPSAGHFSTRDDGTTTYLWLPRGSTGKVSYLFDKDSNTIDSTDDLISFPEEFKFLYAYRTIENCLFGKPGDFQIIPIAKAKADSIQLGLLKDRNVGRRVRVRQYAGGDPDYNLALRENAL